MAQIKVRYFVEKPGRNGGRRFFWQPSRTLRELGWAPRRLARATDSREEAIAEAEALNRELDAWRGSGGVAVQTRQGPPPGSVADLIRRYKASPKFKSLRPKTQKDYRAHLQLIEDWAGPAPVRSLTRRLVQRWYHAMQPGTPAKANAALRVLRILLNFAMNEGDVEVNVAAQPGMIGTQPRLRIWTPEEIEAFVEMADVLDRPSIGDAVLCGAYLGQREGDLLELTRLQVSGQRVRLRQSKRSARIDVPMVPRLERRLKAAMARLEHYGCTAPQIIVSETTGRKYRADNFRHVFAEIRAAAAADGMPSLQGQRAPDAAEEAEPPVPAQFMDLRDTAVTNLAEAGCTIPEIASISGHSEKSVYNILQHYLALNSAMASSAIAKLLAWEERRDQEAARAKGEQSANEPGPSRARKLDSPLSAELDSLPKNPLSH
ncbi:tyrosine-type recombinase/integrase [Fodinicurvata sediminis]|uniref:tyrosine-type recombinase/integrase n=1 Tax=Fodinicurvata sediminis TaxID=1121832 RepID=UPI0003B32CF5|nr:tyrosine-type recombinase/integrase [Fodinicurvata sediminis]